MRFNVRSSLGYSLADMVIVMALVGILSAIAVPQIQNMSNAIVLGESQRMVKSELQQARLKAVTSGRNIRVRFNCPVANQFRIVELIGTPTLPDTKDTASNRCNSVAYPFPAADVNPVTTPNQDGPIRRLDSRVQFGAVQTIEFRPNGTAYPVNADFTSGASPLPNTGVAITLTKGTVVKTVTVNGLGKVEGQ